MTEFCNHFAHDPAKLRRFAVRFLQTAFLDLARLDAAVKANDFRQIGELGHRMKSPAKTIGAHHLADQAIALERLAKDASNGAIRLCMADMKEELFWLETEIRTRLQLPGATHHAPDEIVGISQI